MDSYGNIPTPRVGGILFVTRFGYSPVPFFHKNKPGVSIHSLAQN